jgi:hypothetical protein
VFKYRRSQADRARFCSKHCLGLFNAERLQKQREEYAAETGSRTFGRDPWAKTHAKGMHLSPASEFPRGHRPANKLPVGSVTERPDKNGAVRAWVKVAEPNVWRLRAVVVWEATHGPLPKGRLVHHRDRNPLNDEPSNLEALTRAEHVKEHLTDADRSPRGQGGRARLRASRTA